MNVEKLTEHDVARYRQKALDANQALDKHMQTSPAAPHSRETHSDWQRWIAAAKRLGNVALDTRIAFIRAKRQFEHQEANEKW